MSNIVKMQICNSDIEALPDSSPQPLTVPAKESKEASDGTLLDLLATLSTRNGIAVVQHGARLAVVGELLVAMLAHLPVAMPRPYPRETVSPLFNTARALQSLANCWLRCWRTCLWRCGRVSSSHSVTGLKN
ncbi:hypothetical protein EOS_16455 [Caballeronia mineralivorans PML1(12)]|uniref:Uncharacterized protein n=1 Tax=Caballeronia mineralivorans PML1(12) TaxID=908627 RepID=A0A0J1FYV4_9BURK|nr:hypothetical protein [Caballeronia mineralivorans]KLU25133.1 hypothetical protein EOS_16455 [Caballeronia mineralivorans PML1(12)]